MQWNIIPYKLFEIMIIRFWFCNWCIKVPCTADQKLLPIIFTTLWGKTSILTDPHCGIRHVFKPKTHMYTHRRNYTILCTVYWYHFVILKIELWVNCSFDTMQGSVPKCLSCLEMSIFSDLKLLLERQYLNEKKFQ